MRVSVLRSTLALAIAVAMVEASFASRGLRAAGDTTGLTFGDLQDDVATGISFSTISGSNVGAPGAIREVAVGSGSGGATAGTLAYSRPTGASFYDVIGDLSSKWASLGTEVPVPSSAQTSLATACPANDLDVCVRACATSCFVNNSCQWFALAPATRDCYLYRSLKPMAGQTFAAVAPEAQRIIGYVKAGPPALLSAKATCTETLVYNEKDSFCVTTDSTFYIVPTTGKMQCATSPLTLARSFYNNFYNKGTENAMTEQLATGKLMNARSLAPQSAGGDLTVDSFLKYVGTGTTESLAFSTTNIEVDARTTLLAEASSSTKWAYKMDPYGRVTSVSSTLSKKNLLYTKDPTTGKMAERKDYCMPGLQSRFSYSIHALSAVNAQPNPLSFGGGQIASCLFTAPNGFWNLVPQSDKSRLTGCWKQSNDLIAKLLEWGFTVEFQGEPKYFSGADTVKSEATAAAAKSNSLLTDADVEQYYSSTGSSVGDLNFQVDFPCAYFYRPYNMQVSVTLTGCTDGSYCSTAWSAIQKSTNKTFFTVSSNGAVEISRAFAHWAFENKDGGVKGAKPAFTYLKALATASSGLCFTETGKSLASLSLSSKVSDVLLVTKDGKCVSLSATDGTPTIVDCDAKAPRVSFDGATPTCLVGSGDSCPTFAFSTTFKDEITLKDRDNLVTGTLSFGEKGCLVVDEAKLSFSTDKTACSPIKASYVTLTMNGGDPVDPDEATDALPSQTTPVVPQKREIDDPDWEANP